MTDQEDTRSLRPAGENSAAGAWAIALTAGVVAVLGRLPALGAWWNQDDWGLLARASGLIGPPEVTIRWLSQTAYWQALWPLAGLDPAPYTMTRLLLHALAAVGVVRLAGRLGLAPAQQWLAGLIMAATPLAFTPLYWAAGVQDLMAVAAMVWAVERWLAPGRLARPAALVLFIASVAAKETTVGLPILLAWLLRRERRSRAQASGWLILALMAAAATAAVVQAMRFFATGSVEPYALGGLLVILGNLMTYGLWLVLPGPVYPPRPGLVLSLVGGLVWLVWFGWALHQWRRGRRVPGFALLGALLMAAPLLPLRQHLAPDLAYPVEPFGSLALACLWPRRLRLRAAAVAALVLLAGAWGFFGMRGRLALRDADGVHADPVVRRTAVSAAAGRHLQQLPHARSGLVIVQPPLTRETAAMADELGEGWVTGSTLYHGLAGSLGPRVLLGGDVRIVWTNGLRHTPEQAFVLLDAGLELQPWGSTRQALLYQTLTDLGLGFFERARLHLLRASLLGGDTLSIAFDPRALPLPLERATGNLPSFLAYLDRTAVMGRPAEEIEGLQTNVLRLLSACTGRPVEDLLPAS